MSSSWTIPRHLLRRGAVALAAAALMVAGFAAPSSAAPPAAPTKPPASTGHLLATAQLTLDCNTLTAAGKDYAKKNAICGYGSGSGVSPNSVIGGNCGTSFIWVWNAGSGNAYIFWGFTSSLGPVFYRDLGIVWYNWNYGRPGSFPDANWMASSSYSNDRYVDTYAGYVTVGLSGVVENALGTCDILNPTDAADITW